MGYYREGGLSSPLLVDMVMTMEVLVLVVLVLDRDSHILRSQLSGKTPKGLK
jgi:hypothetical protein